jgi:preprotein translocase subunit SecG
MFAVLITVHVLVSLFLIFVILLQPGRGDGMAAFGGGGSTTSVFGGRGSVTFLSKVTQICAAVFMLTSLTLAYRSSHTDSVLRARRNIAAQDAAQKSGKPTPGMGQTAPGQPAAPAQGTQPPAPGAPAQDATNPSPPKK